MATFDLWTIADDDLDLDRTFVVYRTPEGHVGGLPKTA
jgi:hypothetical protein